ncbi:class I SAM-dependent DNA methyltransferase [Streptomyces sp. NPDC018031]|uniref:class I SAM-dependent DNA methyltransferase n=1 Tax=Streptomyces sp. NPDC018031 TaxID=3365033 RepID=UPI0037B1E139
MTGTTEFREASCVTERFEVDHPILKRMYSLGGDVEERTGIYDEWAGNYDRDTVEGLGYVGPALVAARVAALVPAATPVLDAGCGTGLVGGELARRGFTTVDGVDLSPGMLAVAREKGVYRRLARADITRPLPPSPDPGGYGAVVCAGTFTAGHVGPEGLGPLLRATRTGGYLVVTVLTQVWERMGFDRRVAELTRRGAARPVEDRADQTYHAKEHVTCRLVVLRAA